MKLLSLSMIILLLAGCADESLPPETTSSGEAWLTLTLEEDGKEIASSSKVVLLYRTSHYIPSDMTFQKQANQTVTVREAVALDIRTKKYGNMMLPLTGMNGESWLDQVMSAYTNQTERCGLERTKKLNKPAISESLYFLNYGSDGTAKKVETLKFSELQSGKGVKFISLCFTEKPSEYVSKLNPDWVNFNRGAPKSSEFPGNLWVGSFVQGIHPLGLRPHLRDDVRALCQNTNDPDTKHRCALMNDMMNDWDTSKKSQIDQPATTGKNGNL